MHLAFIKTHKGAHSRQWGLHSAVLITAFLLTFVMSNAWAQGAGYWHTSGNKIVDSNGSEVRLAGVNWYGFETPDYLAHGLWAQDYHTVLNTIKSLGYNVIRIPFSNQMVESNPVPTNFTTFANGGPVNQALDGQTALTDLDTIVSYAGSIGLRVILDNHRSEAGETNEANGLWYTSAYPQANWIADWKTLATRYSSSAFTFSGNPTVIGFDLRNEPHLSGSGSTTGSCWTGDTATNGCPTSLTTQNWPVAATAAGNAVLAINPKLLIFIEGNDCYSGVCGWQGGNLIGVASNPVTLSVPNQLVYSAHDYGPNLFQQAWFNSSTTPASLDAVWNKYWGYISANGTAPVWLGEFGTDNSSADIESTTAGSQGQWFESMVSFLQNNPTINWTYWALNGEDTYDLLDGNYDATPTSSLKQSELESIQFPLGTTSSPSFTIASSASTLSIAQGSSGTDTITVTDAGGFTGSVTLAASGLPTGVTAAFGTNPATGSSVLTLTASASAPAGTSTATITGTSGALTPATATLALTVTTAGTGSFTLSRSAPTLAVTQGSNATDTITVTDVSPFSGSVTLAASGLPTGVTAAFGTNPTTGSSVLTLTASSTATTGAATVTITGTSGTLTASTTIALTVNAAGTGSFTLSRSAATLAVTQGSSGTDTITVTDVSPFAGSVTLAASGLPTGVTAAFGTNPTTGSSVLTLTASSTATTGAATVTITGTSGTLTASTSIALTVNAAGTGSFTLSRSAATLAVTQGSSGTDTITVTDVSPFAGSVTLAASGLPTGVTAAFGTNPTTGSSVLTLTASSTAATGAATVTITGTSGTLTATTTIALTVNAGTTGAKCTIDYSISPQNTSAFGASITINNTGTTALTSWTLTWAFANGQTVSELWNGVETQSGANVTVNSESYNGSIAAGGTLTGIGFNGTWNGTTNAIPTAFSLNGTACTVN
jgi:endoglucanase